MIRLFGKESQRHPAARHPEKTRQRLPQQPKSLGSCSGVGVGSEEGGGRLSTLSHTRKGCVPAVALLPCCCRFHSRRSANSISCARQRKDLSHCRLRTTTAREASEPLVPRFPKCLPDKRDRRLVSRFQTDLRADGKRGRNKTGAHKREVERAREKKNTRGELAAAAADGPRGG